MHRNFGKKLWAEGTLLKMYKVKTNENESEYAA